MKRESTRGGARPGAGRPTTTGSGTARPVSFRLSAEARAQAEALAEISGQTVAALARDALLARLLIGR